MKKGIIGLMTACMLFNLVVVSNTQKVEAETVDGTWTLVKDVASLSKVKTFVPSKPSGFSATGSSKAVFVSL